MLTAGLSPVLNHAGLREREGEEGPDGEEGDQVVGDASKTNQQSSRKPGQDENSMRVNQPPAAVGKTPRHEAVLRDDPAETGKIGKSGVRREGQHAKH